MTDRHTPQQRRHNMQAASRQRNTRPEMALRHALRTAGVRGYRLHRKDVPGRPDLAWIGRRVAVFVDGAFWHGHPSKYREGRSEFWDAKIARNRTRDAEVNRLLRAEGWSVIRLWDFEVLTDPEDAVARIKSALDEATSGNRSTGCGS